MTTLRLLLLVFAFVLMALCAGGVNRNGRVHLGWAGAALVVLALIVPGL